MGFIKVIKNKAYYKRFQTKFRRRRECKTDYYARRRLILQDKNKYKTPKYRFAVRVTNKDIICQVFSADLTHDVCIAAAYAHELRRYGLTLGLTNYAAAYCTGLLLARRVNAKFKLDYEGAEEVDGEDFNVEPADEGPAPFKANFDVGLHRTTTGAKIFGALKGACDGGLDIPHNERRFPGSGKTEDGDYEADPEMHKKYIFAGHVADYMRHLQENDEDAYKRQFSRYVKAGIKADDLESLYAKVHAAIRKDPAVKRDKMHLGHFGTRKTAKDANATYPKKYYNRQKQNRKQRHNRIRQKLGARGVESVYVKERAALEAEAN
jgi:large subunit ribosomal protein L5e